MAVRRIGADEEDDVGLFDRIEVLGAGGGAECRLQTIARRRMADAGAGVDIVVAEAGADHLLDEIDLLIGAARGGDAADRAAAVFRLDVLDLPGRKADRLVPGDLAPGLSVVIADHRIEDTILMIRITDGKAALDAGMAAIGLAVLVGDHTDDLFALHFRLEGTADAAIGAGRHRRRGGHALLDHRLFLKRLGRAGLDAGAAGDAIGGDEIVDRRSGRDAAIEASALDRQREGALNLVARPDAARADDAFGGIEAEIRVRIIDAAIEMVAPTIGIANGFDTHLLGNVMKLAIGAALAAFPFLRMVGEIELHHALADAREAVALRLHHHALGDGRRAGGGRAAASLHLDDADAARAEGVQHVGRAEFRHRNAEIGRRAHD